MSTFGYANSCAKWFPMPVLDGLVVVLPIYDASITEPDLDCDGVIDTLDDDIDGDGILNANDAFPLNSDESVDTDGDGIGNNADLDDDNDGYSDADELTFGSDSLDANSIPVVVSNDGFIVTPLVGTSSQVSFTIALTHKPDSNVTIVYGSTDETVAKPTTSNMTFTPDNWYKKQVVTVDILNPSSSAEIVFEPTVSSDSNYNNKMLEQVSIVSHQLLLFESVDKIVYSEFNMSIPVNMAYVGNNEANITIVLDTAPNGMTLDVENGRLLWTPTLGDEGTDKSVTLTVSDGTLLTKTLTFSLHVATPRELGTAIANNTLTIADANSTLNGLQIKALDGAVLSEYKLYALTGNDTPAFREGETVVGETLLVKGNIGKKVQVLLPLQGLVETDELLSFHTKSYYGSGNWRRVDYDYDFNGTMSEPVYVLNTDSLFGVVAFTKVSQNQKAKRLSSQTKSSKAVPRAKVANSTIHCVPKTWSWLNLTDYDNQVCSFDDKPNFTLQIFNYLDASISSTTPIEEVASWITVAQEKLDTVGMPYRDYGALSFEKIKKEGRLGETGEYQNVNGGMFVNYPIIYNFKLSRIDPYKIGNNKHLTQITTYHEYFHQSQALIQNSTINNPKAKWLIESSAVWFSDYVDDNSSYAYDIIGDPYRLLSQGLYTDKQPIYNGYSELRNNPYMKSYFLEMIDNYCQDFTKYIPYLFYTDSNDVTSLQHLSNVVGVSKCIFGTPTGQGNESRIETALLYYQYIASMKQNSSLISTHLNIDFVFYKDFKEVKSDVWENVLISQYKNLHHDKNLNRSIDSQTMSVKFESLNDTLSRCQERYIRIKSEKTVLVSIASNDANFPDTPTTMLGDMKQLNFGMVGQTDFTYFYDQNTGKQIYPEMYLTITDVVDDTATLTPQQIELGIGLRKNNILSHIDGKDMCAEYIPAITMTNVLADGDIPSQYRDNNQPLKYIDKIKITCVESGEVFNATVASNGTWSTNIHITFNGNESRFSIEGYNASDTQRIIASQGLVIAR